MKEVVEKLKNKGKTISTMESCTGGGVANALTDVEGASEVFKFGAVTYSNEFKIKMGVDAKVIDEYSVYSMETAHEMSKRISMFTGSDYGVGITGKLNRIDVNNMTGNDNEVFVSIYIKDTNTFVDIVLKVDETSRKENKNIVIRQIAEKLSEII